MLLPGLVRLKADHSMTLADKKKWLEALGTAVGVLAAAQTHAPRE
jgi:hypothetical protein